MKKINFRVLLLVSFVCIALLFSTAIIIQSRPRLEAPATVTTTTATRKYVPPTTTSDGRDSTFFMNSKNRGVCKAFKGKVLLNFFMVSDGDCIWTEDAIAEFKKTTEDAIYFLNYDSDRFGVELEILCNYTFVSHPETMVREDHRTVIPEILDSLGYSDKYKVSSDLTEEFGTDSAALIFCFNRQERSLSTPTTLEHGFEYAILYGEKEDFRHELLHLYGAKDLYTPERIDKIAARYFSDSVMRVSGGFILDPLNAFLIGWTDTLNEPAKAFLEDVDR